MFRDNSRVEEIERLRKELISIRERIESNKYGPGFCAYLRGKESMIYDYFQKDLGINIPHSNAA